MNWLLLAWLTGLVLLVFFLLGPGHVRAFIRLAEEWRAFVAELRSPRER